MTSKGPFRPKTDLEDLPSSCSGVMVLGQQASTNEPSPWGGGSVGTRGCRFPRSNTSPAGTVQEGDAGGSERTRSSRNRRSLESGFGLHEGGEDSGYSSWGSCKDPPRGGPKEGRARRSSCKLASQEPVLRAVCDGLWGCNAGLKLSCKALGCCFSGLESTSALQRWGSPCWIAALVSCGGETNAEGQVWRRWSCFQVRTRFFGGKACPLYGLKIHECLAR